jgi:hypothetical protein
VSTRFWATDSRDFALAQLLHELGATPFEQLGDEHPPLVVPVAPAQPEVWHAPRRRRPASFREAFAVREEDTSCGDLVTRPDLLCGKLSADG